MNHTKATPAVNLAAVKTSLHLAKLAECAAIAGVIPESIEFSLSHVVFLLGAMASDDHAEFLANAQKYADTAAHRAINYQDECYGAIKPLIAALECLLERMARFERYDAIGAEMPTHKIYSADSGKFICNWSEGGSNEGNEPTYRVVKVAIDGVVV